MTKAEVGAHPLVHRLGPADGMSTSPGMSRILVRGDDLQLRQVRLSRWRFDSLALVTAPCNRFPAEKTLAEIPEFKSSVVHRLH